MPCRLSDLCTMQDRPPQWRVGAGGGLGVGTACAMGQRLAAASMLEAWGSGEAVVHAGWALLLVFAG